MIPGTARSVQAALVGNADATGHTLALANKAGEMLARRGITLVTGGRGGVMEAASRGAARVGGLTVGIIPDTDPDQANPWCDVVIPTGLGHARNSLTALAGDFVIAVGGGAGTLSEVCFGWIHRKPIFILQGSGGWSDRLTGPLDHRATSVIVRCNSVEELEREVVRFCAEKNFAIQEPDAETRSDQQRGQSDDP